MAAKRRIDRVMNDVLHLTSSCHDSWEGAAVIFQGVTPAAHDPVAFSTIKRQPYSKSRWPDTMSFLSSSGILEGEDHYLR